MKINFKRYFIYLIRWQLSTFILAPVIALFSTWNPWLSAMLANLIGGLIFFWIDRYIFKGKELRATWEIEEDIICKDCKTKTRGYRLVHTENYDKYKDKNPEFRCEKCSLNKTNKLRKQGVKI